MNNLFLSKYSMTVSVKPNEKHTHTGISFLVLLLILNWINKMLSRKNSTVNSAIKKAGKKSSCETHLPLKKKCYINNLGQQ